MKRYFKTFRRIAWCAALLSLNAAVAAPSRAESSRVVSVEEHWELRISQPDSDRSAPQTTMVMSPTNNLEGVHYLFTLNHSTVPEYAPGGMQVQVWNGGELLQSKVAHDGITLDHDDEVVHWVQRISLQDGHLAFRLVDGHSETWGSFGGDGLSLSASTSLQSLNGYRPGLSLTESQVGYAENRVVSLVLTKLVWVTEDGEVHEQNAPIPVDTSLDD
jgi:hypothetical protein